MRFIININIDGQKNFQPILFTLSFQLLSEYVLKQNITGERPSG